MQIVKSGFFFQLFELALRSGEPFDLLHLKICFEFFFLSFCRRSGNAFYSKNYLATAQRVWCQVLAATLAILFILLGALGGRDISSMG